MANRPCPTDQEGKLNVKVEWIMNGNEILIKDFSLIEIWIFLLI